MFMNWHTNTILATQVLPGAGEALDRERTASDFVLSQGLHRSLPVLIVVRAVIVFAGLNLANPLSILPRNLGSLLFLPFFNTLTVLLMLAYLAVWWSGRHLMIQLYVQIGVDLGITTILVANTGGIESAFVSFYILIIIYCSLMLEETEEWSELR